PDGKAIARRAAKGVVIGLAIGASVTVFVVVTGGAILDPSDATTSVLVIGLVTSGLAAVRDELLLHGLTLRVLVTVPAPLPRALACGLASAAAATAAPGAGVRGVVVQFCLGVVFGSLWIRDRGAWLAWGAHAAFLFATGTLVHGGLYDAVVASSAWGGGDGGLLGGYAAIAALVPCALAALAY